MTRQNTIDLITPSGFNGYLYTTSYVPILDRLYDPAVQPYIKGAQPEGK